MILEFIDGSSTVTDVDANGIAEVKIQFAKACHGDVSPAEMTLSMYENGVKYSLNGSRWISYGPGATYDVTAANVNLDNMSPAEKEDHERSFGRYDNEKQFSNAHPSFLNFARNEWLKYARQQ